MDTVSSKYQLLQNKIKNEDFSGAWDLITEIENNLTDYTIINREEFLILKGTVALTINELDEAQIAFEDALEADNNSVQAAAGMGQVLYSRGLKKEALEMFKWVESTNPESINSQEIIERLENEINEETENNDFNIFLAKAKDNIIINNFSLAIENLKMAESLFKCEVAVIKGDIALAENRLTEAQNNYKEALYFNPRSVSACNGLGEMYLVKNDFESAKTMFEASLAISSDDSFALIKLAEVNEKLGYNELNKKNAFVNWDKLPSHLNTVLNNAFNEYGNKNFQLALKGIDDVINESKLSNYFDSKELQASLFNFKGFIKLAMQEINEANLLFEVALKANPESSQACSGLGEVAYLNGEDEKAKIMYEWAVKNNSQNVFAINGLAKVNLAMGLREDDNSLNSGINEYISEEFDALVGEAYLLFGDKKYNDALNKIDIAEKIINTKIQNDDVRMIYSRLLNFKGFCLLALNFQNDAEQMFSKALELNPQSSQACAGLGEVLYLRGNDEGARDMYEWAVKNDPLNKFAVTGLEKIYKILGLNGNNQDKENETVAKINDLITNGYSYYNSKNYRQALDLLLEAEILIEENFEQDERNQSISSLNNLIGFNYLALLNYEKAKKAFEKSLELNPESSQACAGLGEVLFYEKNDDGAKQMFEWAVKLNKFNNFAIQGLAKVNKELGNPAEHNSLIND